MSKEIVIGGEYSLPLASNRGWSNVIDAVEASDLDMPELIHLIDHGWTEPVSGLIADIEQFLPSSTGDVEKTLSELLENLKAAEGAESAAVTDGFVEDDGQENYVESFDPSRTDEGVSEAEARKALTKEWDESKHPRGDDGRFIDDLVIIRASRSERQAAGIMRNVHAPEQRARLAAMLKHYGMKDEVFLRAVNLVNWFGDSEVVDDQGNPLVVYHGTNRDFSEFDADRQRAARNEQYQGAGLFFTEDPDVASAYSDAAANQSFDRATIEREIHEKYPGIVADLFTAIVDEGYSGGWEDVMAKYGLEGKPVHEWPIPEGVDLNRISDLARVTEGSNYEKDRDRGEDDIQDVFNAMFGGYQSLSDYDRTDAMDLGLTAPAPVVMPVYLKASSVLRTDDKEAARRAREDGYDGVYFYGEDTVDGEPEWIVFDASQVKSASGNFGEFDPKERDIRKAYAPGIAKPEIIDGDGDGKIYDGTDDERAVARGSREDRMLAARAKVDAGLSDIRSRMARADEYRAGLKAKLDAANKSHYDAEQAVEREWAELMLPGESRGDFSKRVGGDRELFKRVMAIKDKHQGKEKRLAAVAIERELKAAGDGNMRLELNRLERRSKLIDIASSKEFVEWFGDSETVDEDGLPLVIYHGTRTPVFTEFNEKSNNDAGVFGSTDIRMSASYAGNYTDDVTPTLARDWSQMIDMLEPGQLETLYGNEEIGEYDTLEEAEEELSNWEDAGEIKEYYKIYDRDGSNYEESYERDVILDTFNTYPELRSVGGGEGVYPLFMALKSPMVYDAEGRNWDDIDGFGMGTSTRSLAYEARDMGADGVIFLNVVDSGGGDYYEPGDVYVAFDAHNIKSIHNVGSFSSKSDDILKAFDPNQPRDDWGKWVKVGAIIEAAGSAMAEAELKQRVTDPGEREKLDDAIDEVQEDMASEVSTEDYNAKMDQVARVVGKDMEWVVDKVLESGAVDRGGEMQFMDGMLEKYLPKVPAYRLLPSEYVERERIKEIARLTKDMNEAVAFWGGMLEKKRGAGLSDDDVAQIVSKRSAFEWASDERRTEMLEESVDYVTNEEFSRRIYRLEQGTSYNFEGERIQRHANMVERAVKQGKPVPDEVLLRYAGTSWMPEEGNAKARRLMAVNRANKTADSYRGVVVPREYAKYEAVRDRMNGLRQKVLDESDEFQRYRERVASDVEAMSRDAYFHHGEFIRIREKLSRGTHDEMLELPEDNQDRVMYESHRKRFYTLIDQVNMVEDELKRDAGAFKPRVWKMLSADGLHTTFSLPDAYKLGLKMHMPTEFLQNVVNRDAHGEVQEFSVVRLRPDDTYGPDRAYYRDSSKSIHVRFEEDPATVVHEIGHGIEYNAGLNSTSIAFVIKQSNGAKVQHLGKGYEDDEVYLPDKLANKYAGKLYSHGGSEVISVGVEELYKDPVAFAKNAPEHFNFVVGVLRGEILSDKQLAKHAEKTAVAEVAASGADMNLMEVK